MNTSSNAQKTAFLVVHQGFAARFLLRTDILPTLQEAGVRVVVLTPNHDEPYMREEFEPLGVSLEPLHSGHWDSAGARVWSLADHFRQFTLANGDRAQTMKAKYEHFQRALSAKPPWVARLVDLGVKGLWRSRVLRALLVRIEVAALPTRHQELFDRHRPDLVVVVTLGYFQPDAVLLKEAARNGAATACVVMAWDNPTSKGYRCGDPDRTIAWSARMVDQLEEFQDYPRERTLVGGVPHFDPYLRDGALAGRSKLFEQLGLDPERKLLFFAARSPTSYGHNLVIAEALARAVRDGGLGEPAQLVVRPHPINFRFDHQVPLARYESLAAEYEHVHIDVPEVLSDRLFCDVPRSDNLRLASLLAHADVLVNMFSTTTLEAFLVDTPVVNVSARAHEGAPGGERTDFGEVPEPRSFEEDTHVRAMVDQGAVRVASSMPELIELTRRYVEHPELDRAGRAAVARQECGPMDGRSGERIGRQLLDMLALDPVPEALANEAA